MIANKIFHITVLLAI